MPYRCSHRSKPRPSTGPNSSVEHPQGFLSARKRHVSKDRILLKKLEDLVVAGKLDGEQSSSEKGSRNVLNSLGPSDAAGNETLRTFFIQLTEKMLAPLNRYVSSLIPPVGYV
jgi:hypothetical protein